MVVCGEGAAAGANAADRRADVHGRGRSRRESPHRRVSGRAAAIGLDARSQRADRGSLAPERCGSSPYAAELVALAPDVMLATGVYAGRLLQQETQTVPIVFVLVIDPVGAGFVARLARPGGNATGFSFSEYGVSGKWLELLKELAPGVTRAAVLRDPTDPAGIGQWGAIQSVAPSLGVELTPIGVRDASEIERGVAEFVGSPNSGLIVTAGGPVIVHRESIIASAATYRLPAVYWNRMYVASGGLMSYGPETIDQYRRAAAYIDRILKGEKPADLPVQAPTKYELVINLKTAKALGITVPTTLLSRADEVIE